MTKNGASTNLQGPAWRLLAEFSLPSEPGGEQRPMEPVAQAVHELGLPPAQVRRMEQAVQGAVHNAAHRVDQDEHSPAISVRVWISGARTEDQSGPSSDALRVGQQGRSGWGFFVIETGDCGPQALERESHPVVELFLYQESAPVRWESR